MHLCIRTSLIVSAIFASLFLQTSQCVASEIALTFDDAPMGDSSLMSGTKRTETLISALHTSGVPDVLFFCTTHNFNESGRKRLQLYANAGFHLGNHSHSHMSANKVDTSSYLQDIDQAHQHLKDMKGFLPYHRFPYLHYGKTEAEINVLQTTLGKLGYLNGYVTIDNYDFYLNHLLNEAHRNSIPIDMQAAEKLYVETLWQAIEFYDRLALKYLKRSPKHILLLHENDTAALFLPALIRKIRTEGWDIISPQIAYSDPIAQTFPKTTYSKQGRVAALARDLGASEEELKHSRENESVLKELFSNRVTNNREKP